MPIIVGGNSPVGNSTIALQSVVDYASTFAELEPVLSVAGFSTLKALAIANDVMAAMLAESFPWKWNRFAISPFYTISWQQDYAGSLATLGWLEHCELVNINQTSSPKAIYPLEVVRDIPRLSLYLAQRGQICWLPNDQLVYGTWAANAVYVNPLGATQSPTNPLTQIQDANGNLQVVTTYGTSGAGAPAWPAANAVAGTTTTDGSVVWTVVSPKARGLRLAWLPAQSAPVYQVNCIGQLRPPRFTLLSQTLEPIPDDMEPYFRAGFVAYCWRHTPNLQKFRDETAIWLASLKAAMGVGDRERDEAGFYPTESVMGRGGVSGYDIGPAWPFSPFAW